MIHAVIGAQYGDEGKGLLVDYLSDHLTLVVRFNGGAQAGHTVVVDDGRRHAFGHLGAGCYKAACTLLSRFFIVNPVLYAREFNSDELNGIRRTTFVDDRCLVTTPVDMMLNQAIEAKRGDERHGSCGVGINETVERSQHGEFRMMVMDLRMPIGGVVDRIMHEWAPRRAEQFGVSLPPMAAIEGVMRRWRDDVAFFLRTTEQVADDAAMIGTTGDVIFEGAQGLRLDEQAPGFPHVTRSRTGLTNVLTLLKESGRDEPLDVTYVTRAYVTRHGAGPLANECVGHPFGWTGDETNVENTHQGRLRYAPLSTADLLTAIQGDLRQHRGATIEAHAALAVTCLDQTPNCAAYEASDLADAVGLPLRFWSTGPTRNDVHKVTEDA